MFRLPFHPSHIVNSRELSECYGYGRKVLRNRSSFTLTVNKVSRSQSYLPSFQFPNFFSSPVRDDTKAVKHGVCVPVNQENYKKVQSASCLQSASHFMPEATLVKTITAFQVHRLFVLTYLPNILTCVARGIREQAFAVRFHGFAAKAKALAREIPPAMPNILLSYFICKKTIRNYSTIEININHKNNKTKKS